MKLILYAALLGSMAATTQSDFVEIHPSRMRRAPSVDSGRLDEIEEKLNMLADDGRNDALEQTVEVMSRQIMMQQLFVEERIRGDGQSGIKKVRGRNTGFKSYHQRSYGGFGVASIHQHNNNIRTCGLGEFSAVLNGVEFRTRHNDYRLYMPSETSSKFHEVQDVPFPDVPQAVLDQPTVDGQILEMREWFRAWKDQDHSVRDYRQHFKPALCYLEGAWLDPEESLESYFSDRHFLDASSWFDLQEKIRYTSYTGSKSAQENLAFLPVTIMGINNATSPEFAQWNYRIMCHPVKKEIKLDRFRLVDDFMFRMKRNSPIDKFENTRSARFRLNTRDTSAYFKYSQASPTFLDEIMKEVPGTDNYGGSLRDTTIDGEEVVDLKTREPLNAAFYHRFFSTEKLDAMGVDIFRRSYSDDSVFMAKTSQPNVREMALETCDKEAADYDAERCILKARWTFAIPLEIVWLTPLSKWNPYNLAYKGNAYNNNNLESRSVTANGRNGGFEADKAYNGTNHRVYYQTPIEFYTGAAGEGDAADTAEDAVGVLDPEGNVRKVAASGTYILLPDIPGVGTLRQRYPIMPIHEEGSAIYQEMEAVRDLVHESKTYHSLYREMPEFENIDEVTPEPYEAITLETGIATSSPHAHLVQLTAEDVEAVRNDGIVDVTTSPKNGHSHSLKVTFSAGEYIIWSCDGNVSCRDGHPRILTES
ncbi:unnamed protein product [Owenia fusiformis]|uniref:Uncharacterized protein n=1 Tax=Owenia fusiformis TaxID=6347 RepID=A0A8J1UJB6_OWEFU|nr:unnamed protein product [Owenia fusiformis]